jgi:hypothetical protein
VSVHPGAYLHIVGPAAAHVEYVSVPEHEPDQLHPVAELHEVSVKLLLQGSPVPEHMLVVESQ